MSRLPVLTLQHFSVRRKRLHLLLQRAHLPGAGALTEASHLIPGSWVSWLWAEHPLAPQRAGGPRTCKDMVPLTATTTDSFLWSRATKKGSSYTWAQRGWASAQAPSSARHPALRWRVGWGDTRRRSALRTPGDSACAWGAGVRRSQRSLTSPDPPERDST